MNDTVDDTVTVNKRSFFWHVVHYGISNQRDRRNQLRFTAWCFAWAVSFVAATWIIKADILTGPAVWAVALAPDILGVVLIFSYLHMLREMDELIRRIQLEGLALGFGVGVIFITGYQLLERAGAPEWGNEPVFIMMVAWIMGQLIAIRRYR